MTRAKRQTLVTAVAGSAVVVTWTAVQLVLQHRALTLYRLHDERFRARALVQHPDALLGPVSPIQLHQWVDPALEGLLALMCCVVVSVALAAGGRRRWALLPVALPLSVLVGISDANSVGLAWSAQPVPQPQHWLLLGALVDAATVAVLAFFVLRLTPRRAEQPAAAALLRTIPVAVIAFGWWLVGHAIPDVSDRVFVVRTLLLVAATALLATSRLALPLRIAPLLTLPFADPVLADGLVLAYRSGWNYLHEVTLEAATAAYVAGLPWLLARVTAAVDSVRTRPGTASGR